MKGELATGPDSPKARAFLQLLAKSANVSQSAEASGIGRQHAYDLRKNYPEFAKAWDDAKELGIEALEDEAHRRAHAGYDEPVYHKGKVVGQVRKFSDTLLIFLMKGAKPDKYRERSSVTVDMNVNLADRLEAGRKRLQTESGDE